MVYKMGEGKTISHVFRGLEGGGLQRRRGTLLLNWHPSPQLNYNIIFRVVLGISQQSVGFSVYFKQVLAFFFNFGGREY